MTLMSTHGHRVVSPTQKAFNIWGIILIVWAVYRSSIGRYSPILFDEIILKPALFLWPVIVYVRSYELKSLADGLWLRWDKWREDILYALLIVAPLSIYASWHIITRGLDLTLAWTYLLMAVATAITEETLSRGFVATRIYEETGSTLKTLIQASILHIFLRVPRVVTDTTLYGDRLMYAMGAEVLMSIVVTWAYLTRRSLLTAIVVRAVYGWIIMSMLVR